LDLQGQIQAAEHRLADLITEGRELEANQFNDADAVSALAEFDPVWAALATREQVRSVQLLVAKVGLDGRNGKVTVDFRSAGIRDLCNGTTTKA
jgi:site-specific DNA recombinase